jgi:hypothetical protein
MLVHIAEFDSVPAPSLLGGEQIAAPERRERHLEHLQPVHTPLTRHKMAQRVTLRKRQPYNTTSNRRRVVKTPGGKLVVHHIRKLAVSFAASVDGTRLGDTDHIGDGDRHSLQPRWGIGDEWKGG